MDSAAEVAETLLAAATPRTKLLVVSHVTSPTAVILPIARICAAAKALGIAVCVDGPHAPAAVQVEIDRLSKEVERSRRMLENERFVANAAPEVVDGEREKLERYERELQALEASQA